MVSFEEHSELLEAIILQLNTPECKFGYLVAAIVQSFETFMLVVLWPIEIQEVVIWVSREKVFT